MSTLLPSWFAVTRHVAVHDVNSRYLFLYNSDLQKFFPAYPSIPRLDHANKSLTDSIVILALTDTSSLEE